jgi:hypothetical protein
MKKRLLMIGLLASSLSMMAQEIFNYGFETPSSELTAGKLEYVNFLEGDTHDSINSTSKTGNYALMLQNAAVAGSSWQRALKFRDLSFEPNTSYRVSFWVKGDNTYTLSGTTSSSNIRTRMMVGKENADIPFVAASNNTFDYTFTGFDPTTWTKKSGVFFYSTDEAQKAYYASLNPDSAALNLNYFLNLNVYNPGTYYIDDISIQKSTIKGITYNGDVIKVDFGYAINGDSIRAGKDYETASLPAECVAVTLNGTKLDVEAVEAQKGGFYIFLASDFLDDTADGKLKVSFTNPVNSAVTLKYTGALRPYSLDETSNKVVADFSDEAADYDMNLSGVSSILYNAPYLKSATPENESFDLPLTARSYKLVYSKKIDCSGAKAVLVGTAGTVNLSLSEAGLSDTLTFNVPQSTTLLDGSYSLTVSNIVSDKGTPIEESTILYYDYGASANAEVDTLYNRNWKETAANTIPLGFKCVWSGGTIQSGASTSGSPRLFYFTDGGDFNAGFYMCPRGGADSCRLIYGTYSDYRLHLTPGKYNFTFYSAYWTTATETNKQTFDFLVTDTLNNTVYSQTKLASAFNCNSSSSQKVSGSKFHTYTLVISEEKDYLMKFVVPTSMGWDALIIGGVRVLSIPSTAALYKNALTAAIINAQSTLAAADSSIYDGSAKDALKLAIQTYSIVSYTTPSDYTNATTIVNTTSEAMKTYKAKVDAHFASIVTYHTNVETAKTTLSTYAGTKYAVLDAFSKLVNVVSIYDGLELTNDDSLTVANDTLTFCTNLMKNWVSTCIPALTYRLTKAVTLAKSLKVPVPEADLAAASASLTDDDQIANTLNRKIKERLHHNLALDSLKFGSYMLDSTMTDSLDVSCFIKNPNFYSSQKIQNLGDTTFPGWVTSGLSGAGVGTLATAVCPVTDSYASVFNGGVESFQQTVTGLPVGVYNINMHARTGRVGTTGLTQTELDALYKFYVVQGSDTLRTGFLQADWGLPTAFVSIRNVTVTDGTLTLGVKTTVSPYSGYTPSLFWGDPGLFLVGKASGYTYTDVQKTEIDKGAVKNVQYYTIQGYRVSRPISGLNIIKTTYENGTVEVQKVLIK